MLRNSISHIVRNFQKDWMKTKKKAKFGKGPLKAKIHARTKYSSILYKFSRVYLLRRSFYCAKSFPCQFFPLGSFPARSFPRQFFPI